MSILEPVTPCGPDTETPGLETDTVTPGVTSRPGAGPLSDTLGLTPPDLDSGPGPGNVIVLCVSSLWDQF